MAKYFAGIYRVDRRHGALRRFLNFEQLESRHLLSATVVDTSDNTDVQALSPAVPFTLVTIPDTQIYVNSGLPQFEQQTQWIVDHLDSDHISFVSHLGDIVDSNDNVEAEWQRADTAMDTLDGVIPYSIVPGNTDFDEPYRQGSDAATKYIEYFGPSRYAGQSWYGGSSTDQTSHYQLFNAGGRDFLHLALEWNPRPAAISWAQSVIDAHSNLPVILTTHEYLGTSGRTANGNAIFDGLVRGNPQIFMVLAGHVLGEFHQVSTNDAGSEVIEILADYQDRYNGTVADPQNGFLQLIDFFPDLNQISVRTYSPTLDQFETDADSQFSFSLDFEQRFDFAALQQATFQENVDGYVGTVDTMLQQLSGGAGSGHDADHSSAAELSVDDDDPIGSGGDSQVLLRFDSIFGNGTGQIPLGSTILSATVTVQVTNPGSGLSIHRMLSNWTETDTWNTLANGVQANGVEASAAVDLSIGAGNNATNISTGTRALDVTASVQAWSAGADNNGWVLLPLAGGTNGVDFYASEESIPPKLAIYFVLPGHAPVADDQSVTTDEDTPAPITLTASDADGDSLTYSLVTAPGHGMLSGSAPNLTYIPDPDYAGPDSFTFQAHDGTADSNLATVSMTVTPVNDPPTATNLSAAETYTEDTPLNLIDIVVSDVDSPHVTATLTLSNPAAGSLNTGTSGSVTSGRTRCQVPFWSSRQLSAGGVSWERGVWIGRS